MPIGMIDFQRIVLLLMGTFIFVSILIHLFKKEKEHDDRIDTHREKTKSH